MSEWISVEDRLPDTEQNILMYMEGVGVRVADFSNNDFWDVDYGMAWNAQRITHWMPLPAPPNQTSP